MMKKVMLCQLFCAILLLPLSAQICDGNLGENIFTEGDFGTGSSNVVQVDPQIAPGYNYTNIAPPPDGWYLITNNIALWPSCFGWVEIQDNSTDPNGYMMVVNASYTPGLFYEQQVDGLCENTLYVFSVDIFNLIHTGDNLIRPNVSFLINDEIVYTTGEIPENQEWNTYGFTFSTEPGQTSVKLSLANNAPGGGGNDLALDNITFRPCGPEALILPTEIANICEDGDPIDLEATILGDQYDTTYVQWQQSFDEGNTWQNIPGETNTFYTHQELSGGYYYYRYLLANDASNLLNPKCRVVSNVKIVYVVPKFYMVSDSICEGLSYELGNSSYSATGIYVDSLLTSIGCDSIVTLDLTILPDDGIAIEVDANSPSCDYLQDGSINILNITNGYPPYNIFINNEASSSGALSNLPSGIYEYFVSDLYGCTASYEVFLNPPPPFTVDLGPDQTLGLGDELQLNPIFSQEISNFFWEPSELVNCDDDCENLSFIPSNSAVYALTATSTEGCIASDSISIRVNTVRKVYIPNAFSPNDDGINDRFTIFGAEPNVQQIDQLIIFDRWGGILFEAKEIKPNELSLGWDGTAKGKALPIGTYPYLAKIRFLDNAVLIYDGDVTLVK